MAAALAPHRDTLSYRPSRQDVLTAVCISVAMILWYLWQRPFSRALLLDAATWDSLALGLTRGEIPYLDVFLHKTPGAAILGAAGAWAGRLLGLEPVHGAHLIFIVLGSIAPALLYLCCRPKLSAPLAVAAAAFMVSFDFWPVAVVEGVRPKVAVVCFGLAALLAAQLKRPFLAGLATAVSIACWQPAVVFLVGAAFELKPAALGTRQERRLWAGRLILMIAGAVLVAAVLLVWLWHSGALGHFIDDALVFNVSYVQRGLRTWSQTLGRLTHVFARHCLLEICLALAFTPLVIIRRAALPLGLAISGGLYLALLFLSFQGWPDTVLLLPLLATISAVGLGLMAEILVNFFDGTSRLSYRRMALGIAIVAVSMAANPASERMHTPISFSQQGQQMRDLTNSLGPNDAVVAIGVPELLIHSGRGRSWPWPYFWFGVDQYAASKYGDFDKVLDDLGAVNPALIAVARRWHGPSRNQFESWADKKYSRSSVPIFPHIKTPIAVYRRNPGTTRP